MEDYVKKLEIHSKITISHEKTLLGTGKTLRELTKDSEHDFLVVHTDNYIDCEIIDFIKYHLENKGGEAIITAMTFNTESPENCGIFKFDQYGKVVDFYEKSDEFHGYIANGAVYLFCNKILKLIQDNKDDFDIARDILPRYLNYVKTWHNRGTHIDIGTFENLAQARRLATQKNRSS